MSVKFNVVQRGNPSKPTDPKKHYASVISSGQISLKKMGERIASMSTVNRSDVLAVLDLLVQVMKEELADGNIVKLGEFGSFKIQVNSEGKTTAEEVNAGCIEKINLRFTPGKELKDSLSTIEFHKAQ